MKKPSLFSRLLYRCIRWLVKRFYPTIAIEGLENLPNEPCVIVGNHAQMNGPICAELYYPGDLRIWCAAQMMELREVPDYAFEDFWSTKPKSVRWLYRILSYLIAPLSVCVFNNARCIPVYRDKRIVETMKKSAETLRNGRNVVLFPECKRKYNSILNEFQSGFVDVAKFYFRKTGNAVCFVPVYLSPRLHKAVLGKPVRYQPDAPIRAERERVCGYIKEEITRLAVSLPPHRIVPYDNLPKRSYPLNTDCEKG